MAKKPVFVQKKTIMRSANSTFAVTRFFDKINRATAAVSDELYDALQQLGRMGAADMRATIKYSGTPFSADAQAVGINEGPGRIRTGRMFDSIDYTMHVTEGDRTRFYVSIGYIRDWASYFYFQEEGFLNKWGASSPLRMDANGDPAGLAVKNMESWQETEGTFAFLDAKDYVRSQRASVASQANRKLRNRLKGM